MSTNPIEQFVREVQGNIEGLGKTGATPHVASSVKSPLMCDLLARSYERVHPAQSTTTCRRKFLHG
jgi:hypothetical protein